MNFDYIVADPTGNITVLITSPYTPETRQEMIREAFRLVPSCEQVGFVVPVDSKTVRLEMMAYEFCGNATLSAAAWMAQRMGLAEGSGIIINVDSSGADEILRVYLSRYANTQKRYCSSLSGDDASVEDNEVFHHEYACNDSVYKGTVAMPVPSVSSFRGYPLVSFEGISHLIVPSDEFTDEEAESAVRNFTADLGVQALGLMLCDNDNDNDDDNNIRIRPLVYVPGSDTLFWEHGCATGSTAVGWYRYFNTGALKTNVNQPGGTIQISIDDGRPCLTGRVILH